MTDIMTVLGVQPSQRQSTFTWGLNTDINRIQTTCQFHSQCCNKKRHHCNGVQIGGLTPSPWLKTRQGRLASNRAVFPSHLQKLFPKSVNRRLSTTLYKSKNSSKIIQLLMNRYLFVDRSHSVTCNLFLSLSIQHPHSFFCIEQLGNHLDSDNCWYPVWMTNCPLFHHGRLSYPRYLPGSSAISRWALNG